MRVYIRLLLLGITSLNRNRWGYHNETQDYDEERSKWLYDNHNIKIVRFTNDEVENNLNGVAEYMEEIVKDREKDLKSLLG